MARGPGNARLALAVVIVSIIVVVSAILLLRGLSPSTNTSQHLQWGSFTKVSSGNFGSEVHVYYISWLGCPIGAANSWAFYLSLSSLGNISTHVETHYSDPHDSQPNTPGLIFNGTFTVQGIVFQPVYVYNQFMNATVNGTAIPKGSLVSVGLAELNASLPTDIYAIESDAMTKMPTEGMGSLPPGPSAVALGHINTNVIVTGSNGAWVLNGPLLNPADLSGLSSAQLLYSAAQNSAIASASSQVSASFREA